jgi:tRNA (cmo5U34)-methyltransferase
MEHTHTHESAHDHDHVHDHDHGPDHDHGHAHAHDHDHDHDHGHSHSHATVQDHHDWQSQDYVNHWISSDATRDNERRPLLRRVANFIPFSHDADIHVLDIGAGYGMLSQEVLELFPKATVVCQDYSDPMIEHARERLAWAGDRVSFVKCDLFDPEWTKALQGPFDAVVSSICIHNLRDPKRIKAVYQEVFPLVWQRGAFLNCDHVRPAGPAITQAYRRDLMLLEGRERSGGGLDRRIYTNDADELATLETQLRWLREAGFKEVDCLWKDRQSAILAAFRG